MHTRLKRFRLALLPVLLTATLSLAEPPEGLYDASLSWSFTSSVQQHTAGLAAPFYLSNLKQTAKEEWPALTLIGLGALYPFHDLDDNVLNEVSDSVHVGADYDDVGLASLWVLAAGSAALAPRDSATHELISATETAALAWGITWPLKTLIDRERPSTTGDTRRDNASFPSGHTSMSFAAATYLSRRWTGPDTPLSTGQQWAVNGVVYGAATWVGIGRIDHLQHWPSGVLTGAGIGILSGHLIDTLHYGDEGIFHTGIVPQAVITESGPGLALVKRF